MSAPRYCVTLTPNPGQAGNRVREHQEYILNREEFLALVDTPRMDDPQRRPLLAFPHDRDKLLNAADDGTPTERFGVRVELVESRVPADRVGTFSEAQVQIIREALAEAAEEIDYRLEYGDVDPEDRDEMEEQATRYTEVLHYIITGKHEANPVQSTSTHGEVVS